MTIASDCAAVMTGRPNGVGARLKRDHHPNLMQIHCVANKLALTAGQACRDIQLFSDSQHTLNRVCRYFANSAVRYNELRAMVDIMEDDNFEDVTLRELAYFTWLSLDGTVRAIAECYPALYATLEHDAASSEAKGHFTRIKFVTFVLMTSFLRDVFFVLTKLSQVIQRDLIDIETVNVIVEATSMKLNQLKNRKWTRIGKSL